MVLPSTRVQVTTKAGQGELVLTKLTNSDQGVFICVAANFFGSANHSFSLQTTGEVAGSRLGRDRIFFGRWVSKRTERRTILRK